MDPPQPMSTAPLPTRLDATQNEGAAHTNVDCEEYIAWKTWMSDQFGQYTNLDAAYFSAEVELRKAERARVLELGFGNGTFLGWARDMGAEVHGVEANPLLVMRAQEMFGTIHTHSRLDAPELDALRGAFSHIVAFDVLEHIEQRDYPGLFSRFTELLTPGGKCILRYPNGDSPFGRRIQNGDPTHVTAIGRDKLAYFARRAGLTVEVVRSPALPTSGVGWRRAAKRHVILAMRFCVEAFLGLAYYGRRIPLGENSTAVLIRPAASKAVPPPDYKH